MVSKWREDITFIFFICCSFEIFVPILAGTCNYDVGKTKFQISDWFWLVPSGSSLYNVSFCNQVSRCDGANICKIDAQGNRTNLGRKTGSTTALASDGSGFTAMFHSETKCLTQNYTTQVFFICSKTLGNLEFVEVNGCTHILEIATIEACKKPSTAKEIPCTVIDQKNKLRDLTMLVKAKGGHRVASEDIPGFYINICREITGGITSGVTCPVGSSSCINGEDKGHIGEYTSLRMVNDYTISLNYANSTNGCSTKVTFVCPNQVSQPGGSGPILQLASDCHYEILWETEHACPVANQLSSSCNLTTQDGLFDLSLLKRAPEHYYKVLYQDPKSRTKYTYFLNICGSMKKFPCNNNSDVAVCQTSLVGPAKKTGDAKYMNLRYVDGQLFLTYKHGETCHTGIRRSTVIRFYCKESTSENVPSFNREDYCNYFFDWPTNLVCPRARKTGDVCRTITSKNQIYDLTELIKTGSGNWHAIDATSNGLDGIYLNVCGTVGKNPATKKCPSDNAVCLVSGNSYVGLGKFESPLMSDATNSLRLVYTNGSFCDVGSKRRRKSVITFVCHPGQLSKPPTLMSKSPDDCEYKFVWQTAAACPLGKKVGSNCKVSDFVAGYSFDLSPLSNARPLVNKDYFSVTGGSKEYEYQIKVCKESNTTKCSNGGKKSVGACKYKSSSGMTKMIGEANSSPFYFDGLLKLTYFHGDKCDNGQTQISFLCDENAGIGRPQFEKEISCGIYNFIWYTKHACHSKIVECSVFDAKTKKQYDLSRLSSNRGWVAKHGNKRFYINICQPLYQRPAGCSVLSAVCSANIGSNGAELFLQDLGVVAKSPTVELNGDLMITYVQGGWCGKNKTITTKIRFVCRNDGREGSPEFDAMASDSCNFVFRWETSQACAVGGSSSGSKGTCTVQDPISKYTYDLSPLRKETSFYRVRHGSDTYLLNICGNVSSSECNDLRLGKQPAACKLTGVKGKNPLIGTLPQELTYHMGHITLKYSHGERQDDGYQYRTTISFLCNKEIEHGSPIFDSFDKGEKTFYFNFETALACSPEPVQCKIAGPGNVMYNLETLIKRKGYWTALNRETSGQKHHYYINVCQALNERPPACPKGPIAACQVDHNSATEVGHTIGYVTSNPVVKNKTLLMKYSNGEFCHHAKRNRSVQIFFHCSSSEGSPVFQTETKECSYIFNWLTPSACPKVNTEGGNCRVEDPTFKHFFDLSKLAAREIQVNRTRFILSPCGKTECESGACIKTGERVINIGNVNNMVHLSNGDLYIEYTNGKTVTKVRFICDQTGESLSLITDLSKQNILKVQRFEFEWRSSVACLPPYNVECSLLVNGNKEEEMFDLSPLSRWDRNWRAQIDTDRVGYPANRQIYINVCRNVVKAGGAVECPDEAGICMITGSKRLNVGTLSRAPYKDGSDIILQYDGGDICAGKQRFSSKIRISSDNGQSGIGEPILIGVQGCSHEFTWSTTVALPINNRKEAPRSDCKVVDPITGNVIDLTPFKMKPDLKVDDGQGGFFMLSVCSSFENQDLKRKCGESSGVCRISKSNDSYKLNAGNFNQKVYHDKVVSLKYSAGDTCKNCKCKRESLITFVCAPEEGEGRPVFMSKVQDCTLIFVWRTKHVCDKKVQCTAFGNMKAFNVGRLTKLDGNIEISTGELNAKYYINICKGLIFDKENPCPVGSAACKVTNVNGIRQVQNLGEISAPPSTNDDKTVTLTYENGESCSSDKSKKWKTVITFICKHGSKGHPVFKDCRNCVCKFDWSTYQVCDEDEKVDDVKCSVKDENSNHIFDLSSLKKHDHENYKVQSKFPGISYLLNVCGAASVNDKNCSKSGVCRIDTAAGNTIYQSFGLVKYQKLYYDQFTKSLVLKYLQNESGSKTPTSMITFTCNELIDKGLPVIIKDVKTNSLDYYAFNWQTSLACIPVALHTMVRYNGKDFQLTKLSSSKDNFLTEDNRFRYVVNIYGGIKGGGNGCPKTAAVCRISKVGDDVNVLAPASRQKLSANSTNIFIDYTGGKGSCLNVKVQIVIKCGDDNVLSLLSFDQDQCLYLFTLSSKLLCQDRPTMPPLKTKRQETDSRSHPAVTVIVVIASILLMVVIIYIVRSPERRANAISCLRFNLKKYICCKSMDAPSYKYTKVGVQSNGNDIEEREGLLIDDADDDREYIYKDDTTEDEDDELLQL